MNHWLFALFFLLAAAGVTAIVGWFGLMMGVGSKARIIFIAACIGLAAHSSSYLGLFGLIVPIAIVVFATMRFYEADIGPALLVGALSMGLIILIHYLVKDLPVFQAR